MTLVKPSAFRAGLLLAAGFLAACGKGTPITSGPGPTPTPFPPHVTSEYKLLTKASKPLGITLGGNGSLWFTETGTSKIGHVIP